MLLGNVEARFPILWKIRGAFFLDGGNAWVSPSDVSWRDFRLFEVEDGREAETVRYSYGAGVRFRTPVGPVRLDYARKFKILPVGDPPTDEAPDDWHLSLGHVF